MKPLALARVVTFGALLVLALSGCLAGGVPSTEATAPSGSISADDALVAASAPTTETVLMTDPVEQSFTVAVPAGWNSTAYSNGGFDVHREIVSTVSPDGGTVLFLGDPKTPNFLDPALATAFEREFADVLEFMELRSYETAETHFSNWVDGKFGKLPGYQLVGIENDAGRAANLLQQLAGIGLYLVQAHATEVRFSYQSSKGEPIEAIVYGITMDFGKYWISDVAGIASNRTPDDYYDMLNAMGQSKQTSQEWLARDQANHQQTMAQMEAFSQQMTAQHNANMAWIQQSAANHQAHMQSVWAANDASMNAYYSQMDSMDANQQQFINYINEENTVVGSGGQTWQVTTGATNYYVNPTTGSYLGGDINFGESEISALGYNPNDFEQVTVVN